MLSEKYPYMAEAAVAEAPPASGGEAPPAVETPPVVEAAPPPAAEHPLSWRNLVPQEFREHSSVLKYNTFADYVKGMAHQAELIGRSVQLPKGFDPTKGLANDGLADVFKKLGVPEKPEDYAIQRPENSPAWDDDLERRFRLEAHKNQYLPWQVQPMVDLFNNWAQGMANQYEAERAAAVHKGEVELGRMHGADTENVRRLATATYELGAQGVFGGPELGEYVTNLMQEKGLTSDPKWITWMANIGKQMQEGEYLLSDTHSAGIQTSADIDAQIDALIAKGREITAAEEKQLDALYLAKVRRQEARR